jgi:phytoene desaturase
VSRKIGLPKPATEYFGEHEVLHPRYFGAWGSAGGALYGAVKPFWMSGPLHRPRYSDRKRPWLWRVGRRSTRAAEYRRCWAGHDLDEQAAQVLGK